MKLEKVHGGHQTRAEFPRTKPPISRKLQKSGQKLTDEAGAVF